MFGNGCLAMVGASCLMETRGDVAPLRSHTLYVVILVQVCGRGYGSQGVGLQGRQLQVGGEHVAAIRRGCCIIPVGQAGSLGLHHPLAQLSLPW